MTRTVVRGETSMTTAEGATPNVPAEPYFGWETPFMPQRRIPILIPASNAAGAIPSLRRTEHSSRGGRRAGQAARLNRRPRQANSNFLKAGLWVCSIGISMAAGPTIRPSGRRSARRRIGESGWRSGFELGRPARPPSAGYQRGRGRMPQRLLLRGDSAEASRVSLPVSPQLQALSRCLAAGNDGSQVDQVPDNVERLLAIRVVGHRNTSISISKSRPGRHPDERCRPLGPTFRHSGLTCSRHSVH